MTQRGLSVSSILLWVCFAPGCILSNDTLAKWNGEAKPPPSAQLANAQSAAPPAVETAGSTASSESSTPRVSVATAAVAGSGAAGMAAAGSNAAAGAPAAAGSSAAGAPAVAGSSAPMAGSAAPSVAGSSGAAAGTGAPLEPGALQCPKEVCAPLPPPPAGAPASFKIENCCADNGECGTSLNGAACTYTPDSFADCPPLSAMGFNVPSCCTAMGRCGVDGSSFMMGCVSLEDVAAQAGTFIDVPPPKACTPTTM